MGVVSIRQLEGFPQKAISKDHCRPALDGRAPEGDDAGKGRCFEKRTGRRQIDVSPQGGWPKRQKMRQRQRPRRSMVGCAPRGRVHQHGLLDGRVAKTTTHRHSAGAGLGATPQSVPPPRPSHACVICVSCCGGGGRGLGLGPTRLGSNREMSF